MTFGKRLKKLRSNKGLTQKELADKLHVTFQTVSKWENDINEPGFSLLKDISKVLNCSIACLFDEEETDLSLLNSGKLKHKNLYDLMKDTYFNRDKILDKDVEEYCHTVMDFVNGMACRYAITNGYFKDEKDFLNNRLEVSFPFIIYGVPFKSDEIDSYVINQFINLFSAEMVSGVIKFEETDDVKIITDEDALVQSIANTILSDKGIANVSELSGIDKKYVHLIDRNKLYEMAMMALSFKRENWDKADKYILSY